MRSILLAAALVAINAASAQTISGKVTDPAQKPVSKATVSLVSANDSSVIKSVAADTEGNYTLSYTANGKYLVVATMVGYAKKTSGVLSFDTSHQTQHHIIMEKTGTQLAAVVVTAKRAPIEVKAGKTVVNIDASPTNAGLNALEILEKSPGISIDNDDNISLKGKGGVLILVDGKPTYLSGQNLAAFLKSLQAGNLDQIEIMTNPPAKYDAAGGAGVINIKTKKGTIRGLNGNVNLNYAQGLYPKYNGGSNINYRNNKVNVFASYNAGKWEGPGILSINRNFYKDGVLSGTSDQTTTRHNTGSWHEGKVGMDYYFSDKDVAGIVINAGLNPGNSERNSISYLREVNGDIHTILLSDASSSNNSKNIRTNINYRHTFDSLGREVSVDIDQGYYGTDGNTVLSTNVLNADRSKRGNTVVLNGSLPSDINIYAGKADYIHPFNKTTKLEAGIKSSFVHTDNNVIYLRDTSAGWYADEQRTNHFIYDENINAAYVIVTAGVKKWEFTGGLRAENTNARGFQAQNDSAFKRNYTNVFPNAGVVYSINDKNQLSVSYARRVRRPDYNDLNPFIFFLDSLTYGQGNPYLQPQFSNNIELSHTFKRFLTSTIGYAQTNNIITEILKQNTEKKTTFQTKENFSKMRQLALSVSLNRQLFKWWTVNVYTNIFRNNYRGLYNTGTENVPVEISVTGFQGNISNSFVLSKTWNAEVSGWYGSKMSEGLIVGRQMGSLNAAIAKQVFNKKGTVKIGARDILRTQNFSGYSRYADVDISVANNRRMDNPQYSLSFVYKFGKNNIAPQRKRGSSAADEQSRVKNGGD